MRIVVDSESPYDFAVPDSELIADFRLLAGFLLQRFTNGRLASDVVE